MYTGIKTSKSNGLTMYQVIIRGCVISTHLTEAGAKTKSLRILNTYFKQMSQELQRFTK